MSSHKDIRTLTRTVDMYDYVVSDLVPEFLHERIEHVIVLLDRIFRFQDNVLSKFAPCDNSRSSRWYIEQ
jgi:hypothetical protein